MLSKLSHTLLLVLALASCRGTQAATAGDPPAPRPTTQAAVAKASADDNLNAVVWQQRSEEYRLIAIQTWRSAGEHLLQALRDPRWDALPREDRDAPFGGRPPAVILDVDETVLDNSPYQARLIRDRRVFDEFSWAGWVREKAAIAVPGALEFARMATARGVTVYYISNRAQDLDLATFDNLRKLGFPIASRKQFLGLGTILKGCEENGSEKTCRRRLVGRGYRVLLQVGDQIGDMVTVVANTPEGRRQAVAPYERWLGDRWFVVPNPTYGSWEPALFDNDWSQPDAMRRQRKIEALRY